MTEFEYIPLKNLLLEDNEKSKDIQSLFGREVEYIEFLGPLEHLMANYYMNNRGMRDIDVVRALKNIKANYDKNLEFFKTEFEKGIVNTISLALQNARRKITKHELILVFSYVLWSIKNRNYIGDSKAYLKWICDFFHMYNKEEKKAYDKEYKSYQKKFGWSDEKLKLLKNEDNELEPHISDVVVSKLDSEKAAQELESINSEDIDLDKKDEENSFWSEGAYVKSIGFEEREKMKDYIEDDPKAPKEFSCKKCKKAIGKHNLYWHEGMCNECFFDEYNM